MLAYNSFAICCIKFSITYFPIVLNLVLHAFLTHYEKDALKVLREVFICWLVCMDTAELSFAYGTGILAPIHGVIKLHLAVLFSYRSGTFMQVKVNKL